MSPADLRVGPALPMLLTPLSAARELGVSRARLYELMRDGELKYVKFGGVRRIARVDLEAFVDALRAAS